MFKNAYVKIQYFRTYFYVTSTLKVLFSMRLNSMENYVFSPFGEQKRLVFDPRAKKTSFRPTGKNDYFSAHYTWQKITIQKRLICSASYIMYVLSNISNTVKWVSSTLFCIVRWVSPMPFYEMIRCIL